MWTSMVIVALAVAGCFSAGSSPVQESVTLLSDSRLASDGPDVQTVTVRAVRRGGEAVAIDDLQVVGRKASGDVVEVEPMMPAFASAVGDEGEGVGEGAYGDSYAYEFAVNVADVVESDVTDLEMTFRSAVLRLPVGPGFDGGTGDEEDGDLFQGDALPGETDDWEAEAGLEWDLVAGPDVDVEAEADEAAGAF